MSDLVGNRLGDSVFAHRQGGNRLQHDLGLVGQGAILLGALSRRGQRHVIGHGRNSQIDCDDGRKDIKGHDLAYYTSILAEVREKSLAEFKKRDDAWIMAVDKDWGWGPTNNYCKWFHVCEHEAHHTGQIALLRKRLPGAKPNAE